MSKWRKVSPDQIKAGDLVKVRHVMDDYEETTSAVATNVTDLQIGIGPYTLHKNEGTWYIAKPKKAKPPTRPDEPPVGSFFRVDRTGREFYRYPQVSLTHYFHLACDAGDRPWVAWADVTEPGDTITRLLLVGATDD